MSAHRTGISGGQHAVKPTNWEIFWAGCAGGAAQLVVACPVDLAKIKLQVQTQTGEITSDGPNYSLRHPLSRDVLLCFLSEVLVTNWAAQ